MNGFGSSTRGPRFVPRVCYEKIDRLCNIETVNGLGLNEIGEVMRLYPTPIMHIRFQTIHKFSVVFLMCRIAFHDILFLFSNPGEFRIRGHGFHSSFTIKTTHRQSRPGHFVAGLRKTDGQLKNSRPAGFFVQVWFGFSTGGPAILGLVGSCVVKVSVRTCMYTYTGISHSHPKPLQR